MTKFDFISQKTEYKEIFDACILAENAKTPSDMASCCRKALTNIVEFIYDKHKVPMQANATLLELIDKLNADETVNGILCQLPLPKHIDEASVIAAIAPEAHSASIIASRMHASFFIVIFLRNAQSSKSFLSVLSYPFLRLIFMPAALMPSRTGMKG